MKKSVLIFITIIICGISFAQNRGDRQKYEGLEAYARAFGIIRYYSPNPYALDWEEIDWTYICYKDVKAIQSGESVREVIENLASVMAPSAKITSKPEPSSRKIQGLCSEYSYLLHRGCGEIKISKISKLLNKELRDYKPFSIELISCSEKLPVVENGHSGVLPLDPSELPRPDSIYCYRLSPDLYLNIPHAERADAFSKKDISGMLKSAEDLWHSTMESYGKKFRERVGGLMGERAFKVSSAILRWNIIQHFYPYHEEDGLHWEDHLQNMMAAVDTLPECMMYREEMYEYYNAVRKSLKPVKDAHLMTYSSSYLGKYYSFYMPKFYVPEVFEYEDGKIMLDGSEVLSLNGKGIDAVWDEAKELVVSSNESAVYAGALNLLTETPEPNTPFVIELRNPVTKTLRVDTLYASSDTPGCRLPDNQQVVHVIDDVLVVDPTVSQECYEQFRQHLDSMNRYRAVIFDIRGYPAFDFENVLQHIIDVPVSTDFFILQNPASRTDCTFIMNLLLKAWLLPTLI